MAVQLKLAAAFVDVEINRAAFDTGLARVVADLDRLKGLGMVTLRLDSGAATAQLDLFRQQLEALGKVAGVNVGIGGGGRSGGGGSRSGGGGPPMVGLGQLQMSGINLRGNLAKAEDQAAAREAAAQSRAAQQLAAQQARATLAQMVADEKAAAREVAAQKAAAMSLAAQQSRAAFRQMADDEKSAAREVAAQKRAAQSLAAQQSRAVLAQMTADEKAAAREVAAAQQASAQDRARALASVTQGGMGLMQGLGLGQLAMSPSMMAGQMIGSGLRDSVGTAMDLEQTFVGLQRVSGESAANVDKFKRSLFDIGKSQAGVSVKDLTDISMAGAKAGITDKEGLAGLETFTRGMAKVRNSIQGMGTEQLANDMTRMLNLFHKGTDYVESFGSVLARMDNVSTSSASDILDMSKSLSGTFASLGMGIPQVMAFSSVLADVGLTNQQGASSFSQILRMLASQSEELAGKIGVPVEEFQAKVRTDAMGALGMLIAKFRELNDVDPIKAQEFLVSLGFRGVKTAGALQQLSSMFEQVQERTKMAIEEESSLGSLLSANAMNSTTAAGNIQKLRNAFEELADAIGKNVVPALTEASKVALTMVNGLGKPVGEGAPGGKATNPLSFGEGLEFVGMQLVASIGGAIPESEDFKAKLNGFKRRLEESFAAGDKKALEAPATTPEERKDVGAIAMKEAWADAAKEGPAGGGGGPGGGLGFARDQDRRQAERLAAEAAGREEQRAGVIAGRGAMLARPGGGGEMSEFYRKGFASPEELAEDERRKALAFVARPKEDEQKFQSQSFGDPADFARTAIQTALSDQDDTGKATVEELKIGNTLMRDLVARVTPMTAITPDQSSNAMMILRGPS